MKKKRRIQAICAIACCLFAVSACGDSRDQEENLPLVSMQESDLEEREESAEDNETGSDEIGNDETGSDKNTEEIPAEESDEEGGTRNDTELENIEETPTEENGILELYADRDVISIPDDMMIAKISPQEILSGNPILYDRFRIDRWIFEWLISDYFDEENRWLEDGVLVISREGDAEDMQVIHVTAEGQAEWWVSVENKFEYADVNFDDIPDLLICTGHHGNQGLLTYYCFLQTEDGFAEAPTFTDIPNPAIDADNQLILSQWRNSAASHSWAEYECQDNTYVMIRELCEYLEWEEYDDEEVWVWTVNGEVIGRSDELSESEIDDLIYNENSEWGISGDRWRTLYNHGLTTDYSIYSEP